MNKANEKIDTYHKKNKKVVENEILGNFKK